MNNLTSLSWGDICLFEVLVWKQQPLVTLSQWEKLIRLLAKGARQNDPKTEKRFVEGSCIEPETKYMSSPSERMLCHCCSMAKLTETNLYLREGLKTQKKNCEQQGFLNHSNAKLLSLIIKKSMELWHVSHHDNAATTAACGVPKVGSQNQPSLPETRIELFF